MATKELDNLCRMRMYETLCFRMDDDGDNVNKWTILEYDFVSRSRLYK